MSVLLSLLASCGLALLGLVTGSTILCGIALAGFAALVVALQFIAPDDSDDDWNDEW